MTRINTEPESIDDMTETKKYMNDLAIEIEKQSRAIKEGMEVYAICDSY